MIGLDAKTGKLVRDEDYLRARIESCLTMREGTHPMRRRKGSRIPMLLDRPLNADTLFDIQVAVMDALESVHNGFEDLHIKQVRATADLSGGVSLEISYEMDGQVRTLGGVVVSR